MRIFMYVLSGFVFAGLSWAFIPLSWQSESLPDYTLYYQGGDAGHRDAYQSYTDAGIDAVYNFFGGNYKNRFDIYIHPHRSSLDSMWQHNWQMPDFKSECWMVASGTATQLDVLSPIVWADEACEHDPADQTETQRIITHELVHVYHGQQNVSPDFSEVYQIDWFVEGLATYASGQCDASKINAVKMAIMENKIPTSLDNFWTGNLRYALSGSVVLYIDKTFGRDKLIALLPFNKKEDILNTLGTNEEKLLEGWRRYMSEL